MPGQVVDATGLGEMSKTVYFVGVPGRVGNGCQEGGFRSVRADGGDARVDPGRVGWGMDGPERIGPVTITG